MVRHLEWRRDPVLGELGCGHRGVRVEPSSLLKNLEMESFRILAGRCWGGAVELDVIFQPGVGCTLTRGG